MSSIPHHPLEADEDDIPTGRFNGRMVGAQPLAPDHQRELQDVLRDHAAAAWGELRGIDKLDSAKAERILAQAMAGLIAALRTKARSPANAHRVEEYRSTAIKLRAALMTVWGEPKMAGEVSLGSQKTCRVCKQLKNQHKPSCLVGIALEAAKKSGILTT